MPRRTTPAPPRLHDLRLPELADGASTTIHPYGTYEALAFTGDDLTGAQAERMAFTDSELGALDVSGATLRDVDLRGVDLPEITGLAHLRGAALNHLQLQQLAPAMAAHLGIDVED